LSTFAPYAGLRGVVAIGPIFAANALIEPKLNLVASIDTEMHHKVTDKGRSWFVGKWEVNRFFACCPG
jgi:hypothetical protein